MIPRFAPSEPVGMNDSRSTEEQENSSALPPLHFTSPPVTAVMPVGLSLIVPVDFHSPDPSRA
ncbi:hypothetical protein D3C83_236000 [compost metagenome]